MAGEIVRKQIKALRFTLVSPEEIKKLSVAKIVTPELYDIDGYPVDGGLMDLRMGVIDPGLKCRTDGATMKECPGYPGSIELARPVIHLKYVSLIEMGLKCFCHECGKLTLKEGDFEKSENSTLFLVYWPDWKDKMIQIRDIKKDNEALVIYAPRSAGQIPENILSRLDEKRNVTVANFRGRLMNDMVTAMITTGYSKK